MSKLDISAFEDAVAQLETSYRFLHSKMSREDPALRRQFRAATIQAFEFTYELAVKMVRRQLAEIVINPAELRSMPFVDLMRSAADAELIRAAPPFRIYREMRNISSHTYDAERAEQVVAVVDEFLDDVRLLLQQLRVRNREAD